MSTTVSSAKTANTPSNPSFIPKMVSPGSSLGGPLPSEPLAPMGSMPSLASLLSSGSSCGVGKGWEMDGGTGQSSGENNSGAAGIGHHRRRVFHARVGDRRARVGSSDATLTAGDESVPPYPLVLASVDMLRDARPGVVARSLCGTPGGAGPSRAASQNTETQKKFIPRGINLC